MTEFDYDLFTIGAGSGGVRASRVAASTGVKIGIAEEYRVGGTCVIRGCVPKKLFVYASHFSEDFSDAAAYGWDVQRPVFSWKKLITNKDKEIDRLNQIYIKNLKASGVEIFKSRAVLKDPHTVYLKALNKTITARTILIATGAAPWKDESTLGMEHVISSNEAFHLENLPERILIVGGGYIAVEFAGIFNGLGVQTTLSYRKGEILRGFDDDLRAALHEEMEKKGVTILIHSLIEKIELQETPDKHFFRVTFVDGCVLETDLVMTATGRRPYTQGLGLEEAGVALDEIGAVEVDDFSQSSVPHIYAVGDVTNRANLTPVAIREGAAFAETVFKNNPVTVNHANIPTAVFSQPELGTVGLTEADAKLQGHEVTIFKSVFTPMKHTLTGAPEKALMKLVVDSKTDVVLGVHLMGPASGEMIQSLGIPILMGATKAQFDATIAVHPTAAEELVTMK